MGNIQIDTALIDELVRDLRAGLKNLKSSKSIAESVAQDTGHTELAKKVKDFSSSWTAKREDIVDGLETLMASLEVVSAEFKETEKFLARAAEVSIDSTGGAP